MSPKEVTAMYGLPHCTTCQKAQANLEAQGYTIKKTVDVKTEPVSIETIKQLADAVGGPANLFSKRALKYRALGLHEKTLTDTEMLDWMAKEYTFIKRPVVVFADGSVVSGKSKF